jgi:hypothetical protein
MRIDTTDPNFLRHLARVKAQANLPAHTVETDAGTAYTFNEMLSADSDNPAIPARQAAIEQMMQANPAGTDRLLHDLTHPRYVPEQQDGLPNPDRLAITGAVRSRPRTAVDSEPGRVGLAIRFIGVYGSSAIIALTFCGVVAWAVVKWLGLI